MKYIIEQGQKPHPHSFFFYFVRMCECFVPFSPYFGTWNQGNGMMMESSALVANEIGCRESAVVGTRHGESIGPLS